MRVALISIGTDGDIFPYVGLGAVLRTRGHSITLVASEDYAPLARKHGFDFRQLVSAGENQELFGHPDFWNPLKTAPLSARWGRRFLRRQYELLAGMATPETVFLANPGVFAASLVHEKFGVPWANLVLQPGLILSSIAPPVMPNFAFLSGAPRPVWKAFWRGLDLVGDVLVGRELNDLRSAVGLKPVRRLFSNWLSRELALGMFPEWYGPPQPDWPPQIRVVGFPLYDAQFDETLPPVVEEFCRAGTPPVAFTFGSGMAHPARLFGAALEACRILDVRAIFLTKHRDQLPAPLPSTILPCAFAPFRKLFPHCAAVVHHGGVGTVAESMAAGVPQLVHPICFDQADNGARVRQLGIGDTLRAGRSTGPQIAKQLSAVMTDAVREKCRQFMPRLNGADALTTAAKLLERLAGRRA